MTKDQRKFLSELYRYKQWELNKFKEMLENFLGESLGTKSGSRTWSDEYPWAKKPRAGNPKYENGWQKNNEPA